jgi:hypothetical protein
MRRRRKPLHPNRWTPTFAVNGAHRSSRRNDIRFIARSSEEDGALQAAEVLAAADLRGIDSHGVARLHTYFDMLSEGRKCAKHQSFPNRRLLRSPSAGTRPDWLGDDQHNEARCTLVGRCGRDLTCPSFRFLFISCFSSVTYITN